MDDSGRLTAGTEGLETAHTDFFQKIFGKNAADCVTPGIDLGAAWTIAPGVCALEGFIEACRDALVL